MAPIRRVVLDLLKPYEPTTQEFASRVADASGVKGVNASLVETDQNVQNLKLTIEGDDVDFEEVETIVDELGGAIHSVDQVAAGAHIVEESKTPQD
ncbi:DUF211 domain-containing protein [Halobacteriaceae archaeon GCM10025711]